MLKIENISKTYKRENIEIEALKNINLVLPNRGLITIVGASGCGKTTLLNLIGMIDKPTQGSIRYKNINFTNINGDYIRSKVVTTVSQEDIFFQELTVLENIKLTIDAQNSTVNNGEIKKYLAEVELYDKLNAFPKELSTGQKQRITFVRSMIREYDILLADEPTANLDEKTELLLFKLLREISEDKLVLLVTHNRTLASKFSDRIIEIEDGRIIYDVNNESKRSIVIDTSNNIVYVSNDAYIDNTDWGVIKRLILEKEELLLKLDKTDSTISSKNFYISNNDIIHMREVEIKQSLLRFLSLNMFLNQKTKFLLYSLVTAFLLTIISALLFFSNFDKGDFIYNTFQDNDILYSNYVLMSDFEPIIIKYEDIDGIYESTNSNVIELTNFNEEIMIVDMPSNIELSYFERSDSYMVKGYAYVSENELEIIEGEYPNYNQVMITDYTADRIISSKVEDVRYIDLIGTKIEYLEYSFEISGIIDTDMEDFAVLKSDFEGPIQLAREFDMRCNDIYQRLYLPKDFVNHELSLDKTSLVVDSGTLTIEVSKQIIDYFDSNERIIQEFGTDKNIGIYLSETLYQHYLSNEFSSNQVPTIYIGKNIYNVIGVVNDDEYRIYVDEYNYEILIREYYEVNEILVDVSDVTTVSYLYNNDFTHQTHLSDEINNINNFVVVIQDLLAIIVILLVIVICTILVINQKSINKNNNERWILLRMMGLKVKHFLYFVQYYHFATTVVISLFAFILSFLCVLLVNRYINNKIGIHFEVMELNYFNLIVIILVYLLSVTLINIIFTRHALSREIINLIHNKR